MTLQTHRLRPLCRVMWAAVICAASIMAVSPPAASGILSKLLREAGEAGGKAGKHGIASLDNAAGALRKLPDGEQASALAVHGSPEGHWIFVNSKGDRFTAGTPDELARAPGTLLGKATDGKVLSLYLSEDTLFQTAAKLDALPRHALLHVVANKKIYPLIRRADLPRGHAVRIRPDLKLSLGEQSLFKEALYRLDRRLNPASMRILAFEPGGPKTMSSVPAYDPKTKRRLAEAVDPAVLGQALRKLKGQTVVVTGKVEGGVLRFNSASGDAGQLPLNDIAAAARAADVNLVILRSRSPTQPGAKTWLWQTVEVDGLETALKRPSFADFLQSLTAQSGELHVDVRRGAAGRLIVSAKPTGGAAVGGDGHIGGWIDVLTEQVTGAIATNGIEAFTRDRETEREYAWRFVPGLPSAVQFMYLGGLIAGLMAFGIARDWWRVVWPYEQRNEYRGRAGYQAARITRGLAFIFLFLPIAGLPALIWSFVRIAIMIVKWPFELIGGIFGARRS